MEAALWQTAVASIASLIATLSGAVIGARVQRQATAQLLEAAEAEEQRLAAEQRRLDLRAACVEFVAALTAHRQQQNTKRDLIGRGASEQRLEDARAERYATRTRVTTARTELRFAGADEELLALADEAINRAYLLADDLHTQDDLARVDYNARRAASHTATEAFEATAARACS